MKLDFNVVNYSIRTDKVHREYRFAMLSDLHCAEHGADNCELLLACEKAEPDLILTGGDITTNGRIKVDHKIAYRFLKHLAQIAPVCSVNGNHETRNREEYPVTYAQYEEAAAKAGILLLNNRTAGVDLGDDIISVTGLELPLYTYRKFRKPVLGQSLVEELIGQPDREHFQILLAHNPQFLPRYFQWGADLSFCGHFHGGVMRFPGGRCLVSPYGFPLPYYGYGSYRSGRSRAIVTSGLGEHVLPFRINNPMELVVVSLKPAR